MRTGRRLLPLRWWLAFAAFWLRRRGGNGGVGVFVFRALFCGGRGRGGLPCTPYPMEVTIRSTFGRSVGDYITRLEVKNPWQLRETLGN